MTERGKNLLRNPCAKEGLDYWQVVYSGGDGFGCEEVPAGCKKLSECYNVKGKDEMPCWTTSYGLCEKYQLVYLPEFDISEDDLDNKKPPIRIQDWYCSRSDCGCEYRISVSLIADDNETELDAWNFTDTIKAGSDWIKVEHVFQNYPSGVRYVEFKHGGQDTKNWAGHYGVKIKNSGVFVGKKRIKEKKMFRQKWGIETGKKRFPNNEEFKLKSFRCDNAVREKLDKNLLKNPCASSYFEGWEVVRNGGDGWCCEEEPYGCKPIKEVNDEAEEEMPCWATSYGFCEKYQLVYLPEFDISEEELDNKKPPIRIRDWYCARFDCGCEYKISVLLLAYDKETVLDALNFTDIREEGSDWTKVEHVFLNYPSGVRYVEFKHGGKDTKFWAGHYGVKITDSGVFVGKKRSNKKKMAVREILGKNLLKNPCASLNLGGWEIESNGGDGWCCEAKPSGCRSIKEVTGEAEDEMPCWATSYDLCEKYQLVYLPEFDISEDELDNKRPPLRIRDWYAARNDCGCKYRIRVRLLADDKETELDAWNFTDTRHEGSDWTKVEHLFQNYPSGVRYVEFKHGGQDTKNWAGHFGVKITNSGVFVVKTRSNKKRRAVGPKLCKNLLKNPCSSSKMKGWEVVSNGGDGWCCEAEPCGCKSIIEVNEEAEEESCWSTSHQDCEKKQVVDLEFEGFDPDYMDEIQPEIKVSEWFGFRFDAGCMYWLKVRLLNCDMEMVYEKDVKVKKEAKGDWYKVEESFTAYGPGVRFIEYSHGGRDTCSWAGNFGAKITGSFVGVVAEAETSSSSSSSSDEN